LLLYVGTIVLVLGAAFFLKYAFDREWITESMRVVLGGLVGMALVVGGLRLGRAGYDAYGQVLTGGGLAVLYLAIYAAFGFYGLIGAGVAFALLTMVTAGAALLADRQDSQPMALMAIGGPPIAISAMGCESWRSAAASSRRSWWGGPPTRRPPCSRTSSCWCSGRCTSQDDGRGRG
jgi:uncharacterized membrane protein